MVEITSHEPARSTAAADMFDEIWGDIGREKFSPDEVLRDFDILCKNEQKNIIMQYIHGTHTADEHLSDQRRMDIDKYRGKEAERVSNPSIRIPYADYEQAGFYRGDLQRRILYHYLNELSQSDLSSKFLRQKVSVNGAFKKHDFDITPLSNQEQEDFCLDYARHMVQLIKYSYPSNAAEKSVFLKKRHETLQILWGMAETGGQENHPALEIFLDINELITYRDKLDEFGAKETSEILTTLIEAMLKAALARGKVQASLSDCRQLDGELLEKAVNVEQKLTGHKYLKGRKAEIIFGIATLGLAHGVKKILSCLNLVKDHRFFEKTRDQFEDMDKLMDAVAKTRGDDSSVVDAEETQNTEFRPD